MAQLDETEKGRLACEAGRRVIELPSLLSAGFVRKLSLHFLAL
jgi:hypothetical protein